MCELARAVLQIGEESRCEHLLLTHFSQRYPKVPALGDVLRGKTGVAFDMMTVSPATMHLPAALLPAVQALFEEELA